jgi:hypothetical protein
MITQNESKPQEGITRRGFRAQVRDQILRVEELTDRQVKAAISLLALSMDRQMSIAHWMAYHLLEVTAAEWGELLKALEKAGVLRIERQNNVRAWLRWL